MQRRSAPPWAGDRTPGHAADSRSCPGGTLRDDRCRCRAGPSDDHLASRSRAGVGRSGRHRGCSAVTITRAWARVAFGAAALATGYLAVVALGRSGDEEFVYPFAALRAMPVVAILYILAFWAMLSAEAISKIGKGSLYPFAALRARRGKLACQGVLPCPAELRWVGVRTHTSRCPPTAVRRLAPHPVARSAAARSASPRGRRPSTATFRVPGCAAVTTRTARESEEMKFGQTRPEPAALHRRAPAEPAKWT